MKCSNPHCPHGCEKGGNVPCDKCMNDAKNEVEYISPEKLKSAKEYERKHKKDKRKDKE